MKAIYWRRIYDHWAANRRVWRVWRASFSSYSAQALGCLYVLEGSTLGARYISRRLESRLLITEACGGAFFHAYGDSAAERWRAFRRFVHASIDRSNEEEAVHAARDAFEFF